MPRRHVNVLSKLNETEWIELRKQCRNIVKANNSLLGIHAYNILGYSLTNKTDFHAYVEIVPRVSDIGPMQMVGYYGSTIMPEDYAKRIKGCSESNCI